VIFKNARQGAVAHCIFIRLRYIRHCIQQTAAATLFAKVAVSRFCTKRSSDNENKKNLIDCIEILFQLRFEFNLPFDPTCDEGKASSNIALIFGCVATFNTPPSLALQQSENLFQAVLDGTKSQGQAASW